MYKVKIEIVKIDFMHTDSLQKLKVTLHFFKDIYGNLKTMEKERERDGGHHHPCHPHCVILFIRRSLRKGEGDEQALLLLSLSKC